MNQYTIEYSKEARQDLIEIKRYIKYNLQEPATAQKLVSKMRTEIDKLKTDPQIYAIIDDDFIKKFEIRKLIIDNYIVFYRIQNNKYKLLELCIVEEIG